MKSSAEIILIPCVLADDEQALQALPAALNGYIARCQVFFCENERTARRFFKRIWKDMVIDAYEWHTIQQAGEAQIAALEKAIGAGKIIGIISEAGLPCVADPGALLVARAQQQGIKVTPVSGPSSLLLALMGSGMNGQQFQFGGYLPIEAQARRKQIAVAEQYSARENCTMLYIETPYRNDSLMKDLVYTLHPDTRLCVASGLTGSEQQIITRTAVEWASSLPALHKKQVVFLFLARS